MPGKIPVRNGIGKIATIAAAGPNNNITSHITY